MAILKLVDGALVAMGPGALGQIIGVVDGEPAWVDPPSGITVSNAEPVAAVDGTVWIDADAENIGNIPVSVFTAADDFIVGTGASTFAKKTPSEVRTILSVPDIASEAEVTAGTEATKAVSPATLQAKINGLSIPEAHPTTDGYIHLPANSTTNEGKVAVAGAAAGVWTLDYIYSAILAGLSTATATAVAATDSILVAIGKLQAQITAGDGTNKTVDSAIATAASSTGTLTFLLSWLAKTIKSITGKTNWYDAPAVSLETLAGQKVSFTLVACPEASLCSATIVAPFAMTIQQIDIASRTLGNAVQVPSASTNAVLYKAGASFDSRAFSTADTTISGLSLAVALEDKLDLRLSANNTLGGIVSVTYRGVRA